MPSRTLPIPKSVLSALSIPSDPAKASFSTHGFGSGFAATGHLRALVPVKDGGEEERHFFVKTSTEKGVGGSSIAAEMFRGEYESLNALADAVPEMCPRALAWGEMESSSGSGSQGWYLATEFLDLKGSSRAGKSLARRMATLHSTPAPAAPAKESGDDVVNAREQGNGAGVSSPQFGFPVPTFCGDVRQPNRFTRSWADFYANERLRTVFAESEKRNGPDKALKELVERTATEVVPRLLGDDHLGYDAQGNGQGIVPVVVHGDLWSGNTARGKISRASGMVPTSGQVEEVGEVVYDPSGCYAHNEFDLGIMQMFGGFGSEFFSEYHRLVPKTEPVEEYEDRVALYELYHHLNHHTIFGGGYRSGATSIMKSLIKKYGD